MDYSISETIQLWEKALKIFKENLKDENAFENFFENTHIENISNGTVHLTTKSSVAARILSSSYKDLIISCLKDLTGEKFKLAISAKKNENKKNIPPEENKEVSNINYFQDAVVDKNQTFDNFIVGDFNKLAARAAKMAAENPGKKWNPLFLHSHSGLGKTHLLHAIGNYVIEHSTERAKIFYMHSNLFVEKYIKFVTGERAQTELKDELASADVLLFDDVQLLAEKVKSQEMFFTIYETLINKGAQVVIASDRNPDELKGLQDRLVTRFSQGLVVEINEPDVNTCVEILKSRIKLSGFDINRFDEDVLKFYAQKNSSNIRKLEGALNGLILSAELLEENERITMEVASKLTSNYNIHKNTSKELMEQKIINEVADYYNLLSSQLTSDSREAPIARARHVAIYLIYTTTNLPLKKIGQCFGGKDHSTIKYSVEKIEEELKTNENLVKTISKLKDKISKK